jgi:hypothetical protein
MTDEQYETLWILLSTKQIPKSDLEGIDAWLQSKYDDWDWVIKWLWWRPDVPLKIRKRMSAADYGTGSPTL